MENIKAWLIQVGIKKMGPSAIRAALAAFIGIVMAHAGMLEKFGIVYDQASNTLMLHLTALQQWADVTGLGLLAAAFMAAQHHAGAAVTGAPHIEVPEAAPQEGTPS